MSISSCFFPSVSFNLILMCLHLFLVQSYLPCTEVVILERKQPHQKNNPFNSHHESCVYLIQGSECRHEDVNTHQTVSAVCSRCIPLRCCKLLLWGMVAIPNHSKKFQRKWASSNQNTCMSLSCPPPSHTLFSSFSCNLEFAILRSAAPIWLLRQVLSFFAQHAQAHA